MELYFDIRDGSYLYELSGRFVQLGKSDLCVHLKKDHYTHKSYGRIYTPVFEVVEFVSMDGKAEEAEAPAEEEAPAAAEAAPARRRRG